MSKISVIVSLGFIDQGVFRGRGDPCNGDEFDHLAPLVQAACNWELVLVDRTWPRRFNRVCAVLGLDVINKHVKYIPSKGSIFLDNGFRAVSSMRNAGAIAATGDLLMFVDDYIRLDGDVIDRVARAYDEENLLLHPWLVRFDTKTDDFYSGELSGHNAGIYMASREQFAMTNGYEENFDGAYGEEDVEWQGRLDLLIRKGLVPGGPVRVRRKDLVLEQTSHELGLFREPLKPLWPVSGMTEAEIRELPGKLRCNRALCTKVYTPQILSGNRITGNFPVSEAEKTLLLEQPCDPNCSICNRTDRAEQVASYGTILPDIEVKTRMETLKERMSTSFGMFNPWV